MCSVTRRVVLEPIEIDAPHAPGLTSFEGQAYDASLEGACRIYPHHLDSGGLFLARLRRLEGGVEGGGDGKGTDLGDAASELPGWSPVPAAFPDGRTDPREASQRIEAAAERLRTVFGVEEEATEGLAWMARGDDLWVHRCGSWPVDSWGAPDRWRVVSVGLRAMVPDYQERPRPTNDLLRLLEGAVSRKLVSLSRDQWKTLLRGEDVEVPGVESGFAPLGLDRRVAGRGLVRGERVRHEIPKVRARWLAKILEAD